MSAVLAAAPHYVPATGSLTLVWLLLVLPLAGAAILLLGGRRTDRWGHLLATGLALATFVLGVVFFVRLHSQPPDLRQVDRGLFSWVPVASFQVDVSLLFDQLSSVFVLLITGIGTLVHVYSIGYMGHDPQRRRFFAYLNLFLASMLLLVLADSFLVVYTGWEAVGLSSYLLIGFWSYKPSAATAAKKAFVANRVGDVGFSIAIMIMFAVVGSTSFSGVFGAVGGALVPGSGTLAALCLLLLLGGVAKSAQFPLQVWLPDAMEGPTPASALIHAATMVTAGVYIVARCNPLFNASQAARTTTAVVGAVTLLLGCVVGCAYDDLKKVLAYSTISQIGYMILAVGLGPIGYVFGILHLLTHGFFKAGLFMGAGSVMHGMNDQVDMRRFGALWRVMPITFGTMVCGWLAIIGFPGAAGFFSKDKIIEAAYDKGGTSGYILGTCALVGAGLTAYYMTRLMVMTFLGRRRWTDDVHPHESPATMTGPMVVLAVGSLLSGFLLTFGAALQHWLAPVLNQGGVGEVEQGVHTINATVLIAITLLVTAGGVGAAFVQFGRRAVPTVAPVAVNPLVTVARRNLLADAFYESALMRPGQYLTRALVFFDGRGIDGAVNTLAAGIGGSAGRLRRLQNGFVRSYALGIFGGAALVILALLLVRVG